MIEKDKSYTYEQLVQIIDEATLLAMSSFADKAKQVEQEKDLTRDPMSDFIFNMQNVLMLAELKNVLFKGEK